MTRILKLVGKVFLGLLLTLLVAMMVQGGRALYKASEDRTQAQEQAQPPDPNFAGYARVCQIMHVSDPSVDTFDCIREMEAGAADANKVPTPNDCAAYRKQLKDETVDGYHVNSPNHIKFMLKKHGCLKN